MVKVTQTPPVNEVYIAVRFNSPPLIHGREVSGGSAERIEFRDVARGGSVQVDVNQFLGFGVNKQPPNEQNFIALSSTIASHEVAHILGLRHHDAFGSPGSGIFRNLPVSRFFPAYPGPTNAHETSDHLIASPASVRTTLSDALHDPYFGEREALKLAFFETGESVFEVLDSQKTGNAVLNGTPRPVQELGPLPSLAVPNTLVNPLALNYGDALDVGAANVIGRIELSGATSENDVYSFVGNQGDVVTIELLSQSLRTRYANTIDSLVRVYDAAGQPLNYFGSGLEAFNDDGFEPTDSILLDLSLPATGTYYVEVDTFNFFISELGGYVPGFNATAFCNGRVGDIRCDDTDTVNYELLIYRFDQGNSAAAGDSLVGGAGADTLVGSSGNEVYFSDGLDVIDDPSGNVQVVTNHAPTLAPIPIQNVLEHQPLAFTAVATDVDAGDEVRYRLLPVGGTVRYPQGATIDPLSGLFSWTPGSDGLFQVYVEANDLHGESSSQLVTFIVENTDVTASFAAFIGDYQEGSTLTVNTTASDPSGAAQTFVLHYEVFQGGNLVYSAGPVASPSSFTFTPADNGTYLLRLTATGDNQVTGIAEQTIVITNAAPNFEAGADAILAPSLAGALSRTISFVDPGTDSWSGTVNYGDGPAVPLVIEPVTRSIHLSHLYTAQGSYTVTLTLNDDDGGSHTDSFAVTVNLNTPPVAVNDSVSTDEDAAITFSVIANDLDADNNLLPSGTIALTQPSAGILTDLGNGNFSFNPAGALEFESLNAGQTATVSFVYRIIDAYGATSTANVAISMIGLNDAPTVANPIADVTVNEDAAPVVINIASVFADVDDTTLKYSATSSNGSLVSTSISGGVLTLSFAANASGAATVTVTATDSGNLTATDTFIVSVNPVNDAPTVANPIADVTLNEDAAPIAINIASVFADVDVDDTTLTYSATSSNGSLVSTSISGSVLTLSFAANASGSATVTVTTIDSSNLTATDTFIVSVNPVNDAPTVASPIADVTVNTNAPPLSIPLASVFADIDNSTLVYTATSSNGALVMTSVAGGVLTLTFASIANGSAIVTVTATDAGGLTAIDSLNVVVLGGVNHSPVVTQLQTGNGDVCGASAIRQVSISGLFTDANLSDVHTATVDWGDGSGTQSLPINASLRSFAGTHTYANGGAYSVTVTVRDQQGATGTLTRTAYVQGAGLVGGTLYVIGSENGDTIRIREHGNSQTLRVVTRLPTGDDREVAMVAKSLVSMIVIHGCGGNDRIHVAGGGSDNGPDDSDPQDGSAIEILTKIYGGAGNDTIHGSQGPDEIDGGLGNDQINSRAGNDVVVDLFGDNEIWTGTGNDSVTTGASHDEIRTDGGNDTISAGDGNNEIQAGDGANRITVGNGNNEVDAGDGADTIIAGHGNNEIWSGAGDDQVSVGHGNNEIYTGAGNDSVVTGNGYNEIETGAGNDTVSAGSGNDCIDTGDGNDRVFAGAGNDSVDAGSGDDVVVGGLGNDTIDGGSGRDLVIGGRGQDRIYGQAGDDLLVAGYTDFDNNLAALDALMGEWTRPIAYANRVANIVSGTGSLVGLGVLLNSTTAYDDGDYDILEGDSDRDLFFYNFNGVGTKDSASDLKTSGSNIESRIDLN